MSHEYGKDKTLKSRRKEFKEKCCRPKYFLHCERRIGVNSSLFRANAILKRDNITIHGIYFTYKKNVSPSAYVYVTEENEEALIYYNNMTGNFRGSGTYDGKSFAFHKCLGSYVFYQYRHYLGSKINQNDGIIINKNITQILPKPILGEKQYSIMFYYTPELAESDEFLNNTINLKEHSEELVQKTNLGYENSNISIKAYMHCFEIATLRENVSNVMEELIEHFSKMKGTPEKLRHSADVAVLLIYDQDDQKDDCGVAYQNAYSNGWTFSVMSRHCALDQLSFSHEIAHNFGAEHSLGYLINNRVTRHKGREFFYRTIMKYPSNVQSNRTNYYSNPNIWHPITKTRTGKVGVPSNYEQFSKHIEQIAALGDESCKCYIVTYLNESWMHVNKSCSFQSKAKSANQKFLDKRQNIQKRNDIWNQSPLSKLNLYEKYLTDVQKLYQNYLKDDQRLYKKYLKNAHKNFHL